MTEIRRTTWWADLGRCHRAVLLELVQLIYENGGTITISQAHLAGRVAYSREYVNAALGALCKGDRIIWRFHPTTERHDGRDGRCGDPDAPTKYMLGAVLVEQLEGCAVVVNSVHSPSPCNRSNLEVDNEGTARTGRENHGPQPPPGRPVRATESFSPGNLSSAAQTDPDVLVRRLEIAIGDSGHFQASRRSLTRIANLAAPVWWPVLQRMAIWVGHTPTIENVGSYLTQQWVDLLVEHDWEVPESLKARVRSKADRERKRCPALKGFYVDVGRRADPGATSGAPGAAGGCGEGNGAAPGTDPGAESDGTSGHGGGVQPGDVAGAVSHSDAGGDGRIIPPAAVPLLEQLKADWAEAERKGWRP